MARAMQEVLLQPMDPNATLKEVERELLLLGVQAGRTSAFMAHLNQVLPPSLHPHVAKDLMALTAPEVETLEAKAEWQSCDGHLLRLCLGSSPCPFVFAPAASGPLPVPLQLPAPKAQTKAETKGGALLEVCERLQARRPTLTEYFPPPIFDEDMAGKPLRSFSRLRIKVTKEMEDMCGDLYPEKAERETILNAIQLLCGPPDTAPSWNNWWTQEGLARKKHKGPAITDLERARRNPSQYGCHGTAVAGALRPARPHRGLASSVPSTALVPLGASVANVPPVAQTVVSGHNKLYDEAEDDLGDLQTESQLLEEVAKLQAELDKVHKKAADKKETVAATKKAAKEAEKAKKEAEKAEKAKKAKEAKEATKQAAKDAAAVRRTSPNPPPAKKPKPTEEMSNYEEERLQTMATNQQWLDFIDKTQDANVKILSKEQAMSVIGERAGIEIKEQK